MKFNIFTCIQTLLLISSLYISIANISEAAAASAHDITAKKDANTKSGSSFVIVSTMDGRVTALNKQTGDFAWSFDAQTGPLLSSSLARLPIHQKGKTVWLIPSLRGRLFKFDGNSVESLPITADGLLSSSFKVSDGSLLIGDHEVSTFGVDALDGRLVYFCTSDGCDMMKNPNPDSNIIVLKRYQKTVRSVNERNGYEKWNFSVGEFKLDMSAGVSKGLIPVEDPLSGNFQKDKSEFHRPSEPLEGDEDREFVEDNDNHRFYDDGKAKMHVCIPDGTVSLLTMDHSHKWTHKFGSPIASVWQVNGAEHRKLDLFDPLTVPALLEDKKSPKMDPTIYLGVYDKTTYIQISNSIQNAERDSNGVMHHLSKYSPNMRFSFRPYLASAERLTKAVMSDSKDGQITTISRTSKSCDNNWISFMEISSQTSKGVGFFLKDTLPYYGIPDQSEKKGKVTAIADIVPDDGLLDHSTGSSSKQLIVSVIITVLLMITITFACQKYSKSQHQNIVAKPAEVPETVTETAIDSILENKCENQAVSPTFKSRFLDDFEAIRCLGKGGFGIVLESRNKVDNCSYAVKRIRLPNKESAREKMLREVRALAKLNHHCIVRYYNAWIEEPPPGWQEKTDSNLIADTNMSSNPFVKSQLSSQYSNTKAKNRTSATNATDSIKHQSIVNQNILFEPTEPFSFPTFTNRIENSGFEFSKFSEQVESEQSALPEETSDNQSLPFARYIPNNKSLSIVFANSGPSTSSRDSAFEEDPQPKDMDKDRKSGKSNSSMSKKKKDEEPQSDIIQRSTSHSQNVYLYIQMELCQKESLRAWLVSNTTREEKYCLWVLQQVLSAVEYIHDSNLIHRDLKPSNVFFSSDGKIKVGDFGLVTEIDDFDGDVIGDNPTTYELKDYELKDSHTERVGTRLYMAPEQMSSRNYSKEVDIYATGIILIELFSTFLTRMERVIVLQKARRGKFEENFSNAYGKEAKLAKRMLSSEPHKRPTASEAMQDEVFSKF